MKYIDAGAGIVPFIRVAWTGPARRACSLSGTVCTPDTLIGPCMVSAEGACAARYPDGCFRDLKKMA